MIDKFFLQTNDTIWDFLNEIGNSKEVFSYYSFLEVNEFTLFFYSINNEIVLVALDIVEDGTIEYADIGLSLDGESIKFFRKMRPDGETSQDNYNERLSPMTLLFEHAKEMRNFYATSGHVMDIPAIHLMLLTNSHIANYSQAIESWQQELFGISVLHDLSSLKPVIIYDSRVDGPPPLFLSMRILVFKGLNTGVDGINMKKKLGGLIGLKNKIILLIIQTTSTNHRLSPEG